MRLERKQDIDTSRPKANGRLGLCRISIVRISLMFICIISLLFRDFYFSFFYTFVLINSAILFYIFRFSACNIVSLSLISNALPPFNPFCQFILSGVNRKYLWIKWSQKRAQPSVSDCASFYSSIISYNFSVISEESASLWFLIYCFISSKTSG